MAPAGTFLRRNGEHVLVHHCDGCRVERHNRIAADDDFVLVLRLPRVDRYAEAAGEERGMTA